MGKKGKNTTTYQERPLSTQELKLFDTQNRMMEKGIDIAQQQEDRAERMHDDWVNNFRGIETGEMSMTANRANGYSNNPNIITEAQRDSYQNRLAALNRQEHQLRSGGGSRTKGGA